MSRSRAVEFGAPSGRGNIEKRGKNKWRIRFFLGFDPETGKKIYSRSCTVTGTKREAQERAVAFRRELALEAGVLDEDADATFAEYSKVWQSRRAASPEIKESTVQRDGPVVDKLVEAFGRTPMRELSVSQIRNAYKRLVEEGMSAHQLHVLHQKLRQILDEAEAEGVIPSNPAANKTIRAPRPECKNRSSLTESQVYDLAHAPYGRAEKGKFVGVVIALATGCRRGEVLGLQWKHVHLGSNPCVVVEQQLTKKRRGYEPPKSSSYRKIAIDSGTAEFLGRWKAEQAEYLSSSVAARKRAKQAHPCVSRDCWRDLDLVQTEDTPVVSDSLGEPVDGDNYGSWFREFCVRNGLGKWVDDKGKELPPPRYNENGFPVDSEGRPYSRSNPKPRQKARYKGLTFHELRHTHITLEISNGMDIKSVQTRAGHSKASTTLDIYAHAIPANDRRAADLFGSIMEGRSA